MVGESSVPRLGLEGGNELQPAEEALGLARGQIGDDRFARDSTLTFGHKETLRRGQIDIHAAAETDDPDPVTGDDRIALSDRSDDPPCDGSRDKNRADTKRILCLDCKALAFVIQWRIRRSGVAMFSRPVK